MNDNNKYKIEDFWPGAEDLLNQHFQKKSFWFRYRKSILIGLAFVVLGGLTTLIILVSSSGKVETKTTAKIDELKTSTQIAESEASAKINELKTSAQISETEASAKIDELNTSAQIVETEASAKIDETKKTDTSPTSSISGQNSIKENRRSTNNIAAKEDAASNDTKKNHQLNREFDLNKSTDENKSVAEKGNVNTRISEAQKMESNSANQADVKANMVSNADNSGTELIKTQATELNKRENKISLINNSSQLKKGELNTGKSINTNKVNLTNLEPLGAIYLPQSAIVDAKLNHNLFDLSELSALLNAEKVNKNSDRYFVKIGSGINYVDKKLNSTDYPNYVSRRNSEENAALYSSFNLHFGLIKKKFSLSTGLEMNQYGENIKFNNWLIADVETIQQNTIYFSDSTANTVNYYIQGIEFSQTNFSYSTDSSFVYDTTLVKSQISSDLSNFSGRTLFSYVEIPVVLEYSLFNYRSFALTVQSGASLGLLRASRGHYLSPELTELTEHSKNSNLRKTIFSGRVGISLNWATGAKTSVFIRPEYRFQLQSVFNKPFGIDQRYQTMGLQIGVMRRF